MKGELAELEKKMTEEMEAKLTAMASRYGLKFDQPDAPRGAQAPGSGEITRDQYLSMSSSDRRKLQKTNPELVDRVLGTEGG